MQLEFGYGNGVQTVELPQENLLGVLHAAPILVGRECYETVRCIDSDAAGCIHLDDTAHGTPVDITRAVAEADFRICRRLPEIRPLRHRPRHAPRRLNTAVSAGRRPRSQPDITN